MNDKERKLLDCLKKQGANPAPETDRSRLFISSHVICCKKFEGTPSVFVVDGYEDWEDYAINAVVDGVHWLLGNPQPEKSIRVYVPKSVSPETKQALATLARESYLKTEIVIYELINDKVVSSNESISAPDFSHSNKLTTWAEKLGSRPNELPELAKELATLIAPRVPSFRWYRNVTSKQWSGRVGGWQVCTLDDGRSTFQCGETAAEREKNTTADLIKLVAWIDAFAQNRTDPNTKQGRRKHEHLLESAILRGPQVLCAKLPVSGKELQTVIGVNEPPFQFPALFSQSGKAKYIDALMRLNKTPWILELKVASGGQGQYYRHAITQAVLYRAFVKGAGQSLDMASWFKDRTLEPNLTMAAVAFPKINGGDQHRDKILKPLRNTAANFGVEVIELTVDSDKINDLLAIP